MTVDDVNKLFQLITNCSISMRSCLLCSSHTSLSRSVAARSVPLARLIVPPVSF